LPVAHLAFHVIADAMNKGKIVDVIIQSVAINVIGLNIITFSIVNITTDLATHVRKH